MIEDDGVESNARMTGVVGAVLLVALAIEGVTVPAVRQMLTLHVFMGFLVLPVVGLKLATTGYRSFHYYQGADAYRRKGPPHPVLRVTAPLVIVSTVALLGTGIVMLAVGPRHSDTWRTMMIQLGIGAPLIWSAMLLWLLKRLDTSKSPILTFRSSKRMAGSF